MALLHGTHYGRRPFPKGGIVSRTKAPRPLAPYTDPVTLGGWNYGLLYPAGERVLYRGPTHTPN